MPVSSDCSACQGDECAELRCSNSQRPCGHHCNCVMIHDYCHWCGHSWGEDGEETPPLDGDLYRRIEGGWQFADNDQSLLAMLGEHNYG